MRTNSTTIVHKCATGFASTLNDVGWDKSQLH